MEPKFLLIFFALVFILPTLTSAAEITETRYMRGTQTTVNGLTAYFLSTSQSNSLRSCSFPTSSNATWGIRVWKRSSSGEETEITTGLPVAQVSRTTLGEGIQSGTWTPPSTSLSPTDSIVVRVYMSTDGGPWNLCTSFTTEVLGADNLNPIQWGVNYYTYLSRLVFTRIAGLSFGSNTYNSRIENFGYTKGVVLQPATTQFELLPIFLKDIYLLGNTSYIAAYAQAYYPEFPYKKIGMDCYLNGDEFAAVQNCSVQFYPEKGVCDILLPQYKDLNETNEMKCKIYDPESPIITSRYINKTFTPINFSIWFSNYSSLVGEEFNFPINIKNYGLFSDIYNLSVWAEEGENLVRINPYTKSFLIELHGDTFDPHIWNQTGPETGQVYVKLMILDASSSLRICVNATSSIYPASSVKACAILTSKFRSVPELNLLEIFFIVLVAMIFIFKFKSNKEGSVV